MTLVAPGFASIRPTVATRSGTSLRLPLHRDDPFCGCGDRIVAKMHRRRAGVVGASEKCEFQPALAGDGFDRRQRPPQFLQDRSLLDMKLHVTQGIVF